MTGRTQYFDLVEGSPTVRRLAATHDGEPRWSIRRMLVVSAVLSLGLWTPIVYLAIKALRG